MNCRPLKQLLRPIAMSRPARSVADHTGTPPNIEVCNGTDGSAGEIDGILKNWDALIAEVEEAHNLSR